MENLTSEQELKQLLDEGKINEEEYLQLLSSMNPQPSENPPLDKVEKNRKPVSLIIIACLFIIGGIFSCIEMALAIMHGNIYLSITAIGIFVGWGLLVLSRGWRIVALILIVLMIILIPTISIIYLNQPSSGFHVQLFSDNLPREPKLFILINVLCLTPLIWSYCVLMSRKIKSLFGIKSN